MATYQPGSFFLTAIDPPTGWWIGLGQALAGAPSRYSHAGIVLAADGTTVEAEPGGARYGNLADYASRPLLISDAPVQTWLQRVAPRGLTDHEVAWMQATEQTMRLTITEHAHKLIGTPYSGLDYVALALLHLHLPSRWVRRRVQSSGHMQCAQLVDAAYERAGIHLFTDGRLPGDVMPSDLADWAEDHGGTR